jgi:hypothetical protein
MQAAYLACEPCEGGKLVCVADVSLDPIRSLATEVRESGILNGVKVRRGIVSASWQPMPVMEFLCAPVSGAEGVKPAKKRKAE